MREWQSQVHIKHYCRHHIVFAPKYWKQSICGTLRSESPRLYRRLHFSRGWSYEQDGEILPGETGPYLETEVLASRHTQGLTRRDSICFAMPHLCNRITSVTC